MALGFILSFVLWLSAAQAIAAEAEGWKNDWTKTVEAAKKEGQLNAYGGSEITRPEILAAFNKEYPEIKVVTVGGHAADITARILAERRGEKYIADIIASGPNAPRSLYLARALDPIATAFILPEVADQSKWYGGRHWYADPENKFIFMFEGSVSTTGLSVNTNLAKAAEIGSYWDLLQPKWKGKLAMDENEVEWYAGMCDYMGREKCGRYARALAAQSPQLRRGHSLLSKLLAAGEYPLALVHAAEMEDGKRAGAPVEWVRTLDPVVTSPSQIAISAQAPHPRAARLLVDFVLSAEGQGILAARGRIPARTDVLPEANAGLKVHYVDPKAARDFDRYEKEFGEIFLRSR